MPEDKRLYLTRDEQRKRFEDRFVREPSTKLTSYGCMQRFNITRDEQHLTQAENRQRNFENRNYAEWEESQLLNQVNSLFNRGYKLRDDESLEEFVARCQDD